MEGDEGEEIGGEGEGRGGDTLGRERGGGRWRQRVIRARRDFRRQFEKVREVRREERQV